MLYPFTFQPILMERVWGGRNLERLFRKPLPPDAPIGESWEISDRPGAVSVLANGPLAGRDLRWLMDQHGDAILGRAGARRQPFPLLLKVLDAEQTLSLQVHPPPTIAPQLGGEPKTELWYIAHAAPSAALFAGLRHGMTRAEFSRRIHDGTVADCFHRIPVRTGDAMFLPSGRVHALGAGTVLFEIQQNSDTTYRVFDWNRPGLDGQPRPLHIEESLACIDFDDFEPSLVAAPWRDDPPIRRRSLADNSLFAVDLLRAHESGKQTLTPGRCRILAVIGGSLEVGAQDQIVRLGPGDFCLMPARLDRGEIRWSGPVEFLEVLVGTG